MSYHSIAQAHFNLEQFEQAKVAVDTCRELAPEYPACAMLEANVLERLGDEPGAQAAYQQALELGERAKERRRAQP